MRRSPAGVSSLPEFQRGHRPSPSQSWLVSGRGSHLPRDSRYLTLSFIHTLYTHTNSRAHTHTHARTHTHPGFELSKNKWGVDICLFIVTVITHRQFSIINNGGGLKLTPPRGIPGHLVWGVEQTTGGVQPPTPPRQFKHCTHLNIAKSSLHSIRVKDAPSILQVRIKYLSAAYRYIYEVKFHAIRK
jgi:hypothetical protein